MKILVVGGAGYVGGAVVDCLQKNNKYDVLVYDCLLYEESYLKKCKFVYGDVRDKKKLIKYLNWADKVVWIAALVGDGACSINPSITVDINQTSVKHLSENFDKKIIFFSTCSVYGAQGGILNENSSTDPLSVYASTKLEAEKILSEKDSIIFRLGTLFGVSDSFSRIRMDLVVNTLTARAFNEKKLTVYGGNQYRPLLHVKDAAEAILLALESEKRGIFDLHLENFKILDLAKKVENFFPDIKLEIVDTKFQDTRNYRVEGSRIRKILGFKPKYSIDYGIKELSDILKDNRIKNINNPRYTNQGFLEMFKKKLHY